MEHEELEKLTTRTGVRGNVRYITISDNVPDHWPAIIEIAKSSYNWWAYIYHTNDNTDKHLHILCYDEGGTSLKSHCNRFSSVLPSNFINKVRSPRAMARYLIHKDNPDKYQYDVNEVVTNSKDKLMGFFKESNSDCVMEYRDFCLVRTGQMSIEDFLDKYRGDFASMPFYHKLNVFSKLRHG